MFTGLVEAMGTLASRTSRGPGARLGIATSLAPLVLGESIAVSGVCLTVQTIVAGGFEADASAETLDKTTLGALEVGGRVHLERALAMGARLGGHIVSGHVDGRATLVDRRAVGESLRLEFAIDPALARYVADKGSVAVDGVSLTVNGASRDRFHVAIVPHTQQMTTLAALSRGGACNLEVDVLARYVARILDVARDGGASTDETLVAKLKAAGYM